MHCTLQLSNLCFSYPHLKTPVFHQLQMVNEVSEVKHEHSLLQVQDISGINVVFGPNGCGKSTLLKIFSGLLIPQKGFFQIGCEFPQKASTLQTDSKVLFLPDVPCWPYKKLTVNDFAKQVSYFLQFNIQKTNELELLSLLELTQVTDKKFDQLSRGQKKRLFLMWLWCQHFEQIYLDEPFADLDFSAQQLLFAKLLQLSTHRVIWLSHHSLDGDLLLNSRIWFLNSQNTLFLIHNPMPSVVPSNHLGLLINLQSRIKNLFLENRV